MHFCKSLVITALFVTSSVLAQSGVVIDNTTLQPLANAVVYSVNDPSACDTTDAYGRFTVNASTRSLDNRPDAGQSGIIRFQGDRLIVPGAQKATVQIFSLSGIRVSHLQTASIGNNQVADRLFKNTGLFFVKVSVERTTYRTSYLYTGSSSVKCVSQPQHRESAGFAKGMAGEQSLSVIKKGYASQQNVMVGDGDTVRIVPVAPTIPLDPMPIISQFCPAYASGYQDGGVASKACDTSQGSCWISGAVPAWLAYDLSARPFEARQMVLVAWYNPYNGDYYPCQPNPCVIRGMPRDYVIEINRASGGGEAPIKGWEEVLSVTGNVHLGRQHEIHMAGANWIRLRFTGSPDTKIGIDLDIYDVSKTGVLDSWIYIGDSITFMTMQRNGKRIQNAVNDLVTRAWPGVTQAAQGGAGVQTYTPRIDHILDVFPGKFFAFPLGTNNHDDSTFFNGFDTLITKVIAAGRVPVVPTLPWPRTSNQAEARAKRDMIIELQNRHPEVLPGPDLWTFFESHPEYISEGDVHPNGEGMEELRRLWAEAMAEVYD